MLYTAFGPFGGAFDVNRGRPLSSTSSAGVCGALSRSRILSKLRFEFDVAVISINEPLALLDPLIVVLEGDSFSSRFESYFSSMEWRLSTEKEDERSPTEEMKESRFSVLVSVVM